MPDLSRMLSCPNCKGPATYNFVNPHDSDLSIVGCQNCGLSAFAKVWNRLSRGFAQEVEDLKKNLEEVLEANEQLQGELYSKEGVLEAVDRTLRLYGFPLHASRAKAIENYVLNANQVLKNLKARVAELEDGRKGRGVPSCPQCDSLLIEVEYPLGSALSRDQWYDSKVGDWYCPNCPGNNRGKEEAGWKNVCYWNHDEVHFPKENATPTCFACGNKLVALITKSNTKPVWHCPTCPDGRASHPFEWKGFPESQWCKWNDFALTVFLDKSFASPVQEIRWRYEVKTPDGQISDSEPVGSEDLAKRKAEAVAKKLFGKSWIGSPSTNTNREKQDPLEKALKTVQSKICNDWGRALYVVLELLAERCPKP